MSDRVINYSSKQADGEIKRRSLSNVNPAAADSDLGKFVAAFASLSDDTLIGIENQQTSSIIFARKNVDNSADGSNQSLSSFANNISIKTGGGNDSIVNAGNYVTITSGSGDDSIYNSGRGVTIDAVAGSNYIKNQADNVSINGDSNSRIVSYGDNVTIYGGESSNVSSSGGNVSITGGRNSFVSIAGDSSASISGDYVTIRSGTNSSFLSRGDNVSINGGQTASFSSRGDNVTIYGHRDSTIFSSGNNVTITTGDSSSLSTGGNNVSIVAPINSYYSPFVTVTAGDNITLCNYMDVTNTSSVVSHFYNAESNRLKTFHGKNIFLSDRDNSKYNDKIVSDADNFTLDCGGGNNKISITGGNNVSINVGDSVGAVKITSGNNITICGGDDAYQNVTVEGGNNISINAYKSLSTVKITGGDNITILGGDNFTSPDGNVWCTDTISLTGGTNRFLQFTGGSTAIINQIYGLNQAADTFIIDNPNVTLSHAIKPGYTSFNITGAAGTSSLYLYGVNEGSIRVKVAQNEVTLYNIT